MSLATLTKMCDCPEIKKLSWHYDSNCIYKPTQGVLQDTIKFKLDCTSHNVREAFWAWYNSIHGKSKQHWSDLELWITFYMSVLHKKIWIKEQWCFK